MFQKPFSFEGRIRRTEYGLSFIFYFFISIFLSGFIRSIPAANILMVAYIPMIWFLWAQGAKRCHDIGNSGWYQIIPFYIFWMFFVDSNYGLNEYGENPKGIGNEEQHSNY